MANIKISELNELYKNQREYNDYLPIVDTSADETKKISVENLIASNVELLAVVEPGEPSPEPVQGARYYSKQANEIFYAYDDEHWGRPQTPIAGIFYVVISEKTTYTYDEENETLVSVGGGSGSEIVVGDEEPTEDTKLIIEDEDLEFHGIDYVEDVYSTSEVKTNKVWIDGKPIYRKIVSTTYQSGTTTASISSGISNVDIMIKIETILAKPNDFEGNYYASSSDWFRTFYRITNNTIEIRSSSNSSNLQVYITLEYTKTS